MATPLIDGIDLVPGRFLFTADNAFPGSSVEQSVVDGDAVARTEYTQASQTGSDGAGGDFRVVLGARDGIGGLSAFDVLREVTPGGTAFVGLSIIPGATSGSPTTLENPTGGGLSVMGLTVPAISLDVLTLANQPTGYAITTSDVDTYGGIVVPQTTAGQTFTIASPTDISAGRMFVAMNSGTTSFLLDPVPGSGATFTVAASAYEIVFWDGLTWAPSGSATAGSASGPAGAVQISGGGGTFSSDNANFHFNTTTDRLELATGLQTQTLTDVLGNTWLTEIQNASSVNYFQMAAGVTGFGPTLSAVGADANIDIVLTPKGTKGVAIYPDTNFGRTFAVFNSTASYPIFSVDTANDQTKTVSVSRIYNVDSDVNASIILTNGAISLGVGGGTNIDTRFIRSGVNTVRLDNGSGGPATLTTTGFIQVPTLLDTNSNIWLTSAATASAVNYFKITNAASGFGPTLEAAGTDTNIELVLKSQLLASVRVTPGSNSATAFRVTEATGADNIFSVSTGFFFGTNAIGYQRVYDAVGDAQQSVQLFTGGISLGAGGATALDTRFRRTATKTVTFDDGAGGAATLVTTGFIRVPTLLDTNSNIWLTSVATASAVNYFKITDAATTSGPILASDGTDTNIELVLKTKGTGQVRVTPGSDSLLAFVVTDAANSATSFAVSSTGASPSVSATLQMLGIDTANGHVGAVTGFGKPQVTTVKTTTYTAIYGDFVRCDPSGGAFTVTLPAASAAAVGQIVKVKNTTNSNNVITISRAGADTIDTATSTVIATSYGSVTVICTSSTTWNIY